MEDLNIYTLGAGLALLLVLLLVLIWSLRKKSVEPKKELPEETSALTQELPQPKQADATAEPAPVKEKKKVSSRALASWIPLLKEKTKDRDRWEEVLIMSDMGPRLADELLDDLEKSDEDPESFFKLSLKDLLRPAADKSEPWNKHKPWVLFVVGVNGVGKTTTLVKLGVYFQQMGKSVGVIGADTFRKAAIEQLEIGCSKHSLSFFSQKAGEGQSEGADPSSVIFDGLKKFQDQDVVLVDTSGRLQNKKNLMEELKKMKRVADKSSEGAPHDIWLVLDATLGQNATQQAEVFHEAVPLTGLVLTKMDGLSKGGSIFQLYQKLKLPIRFVGSGEAATDIQPFDPDSFVDELFDLRAS